MIKHEFKYEEQKQEEVINEWHLNAFCYSYSKQKQAIAETIRYINFLLDLAKSFKDTSSHVVKNICRDILIQSYSIMDAIIVCCANKIQKQCVRCNNRRCRYARNYVDINHFEVDRKCFQKAYPFNICLTI